MRKALAALNGGRSPFTSLGFEKEVFNMKVQQWWDELQHEMWLHFSSDEAYMCHRFREEVRHSLKELFLQQQTQVSLPAKLSQAQIGVIQEQMRTIEYGLIQLGKHVENLADTVSWSMSVIGGDIELLEKPTFGDSAEVIWAQEQTNQLLQDILKGLSNPKTVEAEEMREKGNEFFRNGVKAKMPKDREHWMNLAIDAYLESIRKNPTDFSVFQSLGVILFFEKGNSDLAIRCFHKALVLAEPYSPYYAALSCLYLGYVHLNRNEFEEAYQATAKAVRLQPNWGEAHYQHAIHCALTGRIEEMRVSLSNAIENDEANFVRAVTDPDLLTLEEVKEVVNALTTKIKEEAHLWERRFSHWIKGLTKLLIMFPITCEMIVVGLDRFQRALKALEQFQGYVSLRRTLRQVKSISQQFVSMFAHWSGNCLTLEGHKDWVHSVSFSPDGQILASGSDDNTIKLWRISDGDLIKTLKGHEGGVRSVSFSPDGQILASGSSDKNIKLWQMPDGSLIRTLAGHEGWVHSVSFSPDGQILASGGSDNTIKLWRVSDGSLIGTLAGHTNDVRSIAFSPDGQILASGSLDKTIKLWRVFDGSLIRTISETGLVVSVSFSPDGEILASGSDDSTIKLWRVSDGSLIRTLTGHKGFVRSVSFSPDGEILASGSDDYTIKLWQVSDGSLIRTLTGHKGDVNSVSFSTDGQILASGGWDDTIKLWLTYPLFWKWAGKEIISEEEIDQIFRDLEQWQTEYEQRLQELSRKRQSIQSLVEEKRLRALQELEEQRRMAELRAQRRAQGLCEECGQTLSLWNKLLKQTKCKKCR